MSGMKLIMESFRKFTKNIRIVESDYIDTEAITEASSSCDGAAGTWEDGCYVKGTTISKWHDLRSDIRRECKKDPRGDKCKAAEKAMDAIRI